MAEMHDNARKNHMKPHLHLHVGLGKCASTSLQSYFATHRAALRRQGIDYPDLGTGHAGNLTAYALSQRPSSARWGAHLFDFDGAQERLRAAVESSRTPSVLLSSEALTHPDHMLDLDWLYDAFSAVTVHLILRPRAAWLVAVYAQLVRATGFCDDLTTFLRSAHVREGAQFASILQFWRDSVGDDAVQLFCLRPGDTPIIDTVLHKIDPGLALPASTQPRQNVTPSAFVLVALAYAQHLRHGVDRPRANAIVEAAKRNDPDPSLSLLTRDVARWIDATFADDTKRFVTMQDVIAQQDIETDAAHDFASGVSFDEVLAMPAFDRFAASMGLPGPDRSDT